MRSPFIHNLNLIKILTNTNDKSFLTILQGRVYDGGIKCYYCIMQVYKLAFVIHVEIIISLRGYYWENESGYRRFVSFMK
jgi:hypothetical protein